MSTTPTSPPPTRPRVLILGAGASGAACARHLVDSGKFDVTVLEARQRVGGRTYSVPLRQKTTSDAAASDAATDTSAIDLGASWLHGFDSNPLVRDGVAERAGLRWEDPEETVARGLIRDVERYNPAMENSEYRRSAIVIDSETRTDVHEAFLAVQAAVSEALGAIEESSEGVRDEAKWPLARGPDIDASVRVGAWRDAFERALAPHLDQLRARVVALGAPPGEAAFRRLLRLAVGQVEEYLLESGEELSLPWASDPLENDEVGGDRLVLNGFDRIARSLLTDVHVELGAVVRRIECVDAPAARGDARVLLRVITEPLLDEVTGASDATRARVWEAEHVVCTLPLGVLRARAIEFVPPLDARKQAAWEAIGCGVLDKVALEFDEAVWEPVRFLGHAGEPFGEPAPGESPLHLSSGSSRNEFPFTVNMATVHGGAPVLVGFAGTRFAEQAVETLSDEQLRDQLLRVLALRYDEALLRRHLVAVHVKRWRADPFARGSYCCYARTTCGSHLDDAAAPEWDGALRFAGEHTNRVWPGSVHGAYHSGKREARRLLDEPDSESEGEEEEDASSESEDA